MVDKSWPLASCNFWKRLICLVQDPDTVNLTCAQWLSAVLRWSAGQKSFSAKTVVFRRKKSKQQQSHTQKLLTGHVLIRQGGPELRGITYNMSGTSTCTTCIYCIFTFVISYHMYLCNDYCKGKIKTKYIIVIFISSTKRRFLIV